MSFLSQLGNPYQVTKKTSKKALFSLAFYGGTCIVYVWIKKKTLWKVNIMSKTKQWAWDSAEKAVDDIIKNLKSGIIDKVKAKAEILKVDNLDLVDIDEYNIDEVIEYEMNA